MKYILLIFVAAFFIGGPIVLVKVLKKKGAQQKVEEGRSSAASSSNKPAKAQKKKGKATTTVRESIPFDCMYENGILQINENTFSRAYALEEVNFRIIPYEDQKNLYLDYENVLNSLSATADLQVVAVTKSSDRRKFMSGIRLKRLNNSEDKYIQEYNSVIEAMQRVGTGNLEQHKYIILTIDEKNIESATMTIKRMDGEVDGVFSRLTGGPTKPLNATEYLKLLHSIYNIDNPAAHFENAKAADGSICFEAEVARRQGLDSKDVISPDSFTYKPNYFKFGEAYGKVMFIRQYPAIMNTEFIANILDIKCSSIVSVHYTALSQSEAVKTVRREITNINAELADKQAKNAGEGISAELISPLLYASKEKTEQLLADVTNRNQKLFYTTFTVMVFGDTLVQLNENVKKVEAVAERHVVSMGYLNGMMELGSQTCLPIGINTLKVERMLTTECASLFIPYGAQEINEIGGCYYGINALSKNIIVHNRMTAINPNGVYVGLPGSGKSFLAKMEMLYAYLYSKSNYIQIIDPDGEYARVAEKLEDAAVIEISMNAQNYINPLDLDMNYGADEKGIVGDPVAMKIDYVYSLISTMLDGKEFTPVKKTILGRCMKRIYIPYIEHMKKLMPDVTIDRDACPTLRNLYDELLKQPEPEANELAIILEQYVTGPSNLFAHRTNVNVDARFIVFDITGLGGGLHELGLQVCTDNIWSSVLANKKKGRTTWFYIDEFSTLSKHEATSKFLEKVWKRARKYGGIPTAITQNTEDFLGNAYSRSIFGLSRFVIAMSQDRANQDYLAELLRIPEAQLSHINNSGAGVGLLWTGNNIVPFVNQWPQDTEVYRMFDTSPAGKKQLRVF